jgi:hypothetical protein
MEPGEDGLMQAYLELLEIHKPPVTITKQPTFNKRDFYPLKPYGIKVLFPII